MDKKTYDFIISQIQNMPKILYGNKLDVDYYYLLIGLLLNFNCNDKGEGLNELLNNYFEDDNVFMDILFNNDGVDDSIYIQTNIYSDKSYNIKIPIKLSVSVVDFDEKLEGIEFYYNNQLYLLIPRHTKYDVEEVLCDTDNNDIDSDAQEKFATVMSEIGLMFEENGYDMLKMLISYDVNGIYKNDLGINILKDDKNGYNDTSRV